MMINYRDYFLVVIIDIDLSNDRLETWIQCFSSGACFECDSIRHCFDLRSFLSN